MKYLWVLLFFTSCAVPLYVSEGRINGVKVSSQWHHRAERPSQLWIRLKNGSDEDKHVSLQIGVQYPNGNSDDFHAEACLLPGETSGGWFRDIYFTSEQLLDEEDKYGAMVDVSYTVVEEGVCQ